MQTTLLGFAIAIILALVAALVGPFFVDWGRFRGEFEARASRLTGLEFHVTGPIEARLLPTPTLMLQGIEFGRPGEASKVSAKSLRLEFALGSLVRGEWKIADARLEGPQFAAGLDSSGRISLPMPSSSFDLEGVSIQRLTIEDGHAAFADATSDSRLVLDKIEFNGELRSLAGPVKGEGSFVMSGQHYPYRLTVSRVGDDGGVKVRLGVDPIDRPLTAEADVWIWLDHGLPRFEGTIAFARLVGRAPEGAQSLIIEPWRVTSRIKGDSAAAVLEQVEFQYGPDDRAIKLRGDAKMTFGSRPQLDGVFSSPQVDLDRVLDLPDDTRRLPLVAIKSFAEHFSGAHRLSFPVRLGINVETLTLAGAALQRVSADVKTSAETWDIESLEFRAPGMTQLRLSGRFGVTPRGVAFNGPAKIESGDSRVFVAWLADRTDVQLGSGGALRVSGDVKLGSNTIAIDRLKAELDRMSLTGRLAYSWANDDRPARLDAALTAPEIDADRTLALVKAMLGKDIHFDWPREGALALKIDRASFGGVDAKGANISVRLDADGFGIERLTIDDFGGATLAVKGRIDNHSQSPRGDVTLDLDARSLDGVIALIEKFAPASAEQLRHAAGRFAPLSLRASLSVDQRVTGASGATNGLAKFKVSGRAGVFNLALQGDADAPTEAFAFANLPDLRAAKVNFSGNLDANDGAVLLEFVGLDRVLAVDKRPGRIAFSAKGALDGDLAVTGQLAAGLLNVAGNGTIRIAGPQSPSAALELKIANANVRSLRPAVAGRPAELLPMSATVRVALADSTLTLTDLAGSIAGTRVGGRLAIGMQKPWSIAGDIELDALDLPGVIGAVLGTPRQDAKPAALWSAEPFDAGLPRELSGQISLKSARVVLAPKLVARDVRSSVQFGESEVALQNFEGALAGGQISGELAFVRRADGLAAQGHVKLSGVNAADFLPGGGSLTGRLTLDVTASGSGKSPAALVGSLGGSGSFMLENAQIVRFDPRAFDAVIGAVDQGLPIDTMRVRDRMEAALAGGNLPVTLAEGALTMTAGQARLSRTIVRAQGADLAVTGTVNLADAGIDTRLIFSGTPKGDGIVVGRPEIMVMLKGPLDASKRTIDAAAFASWLALRAVEQQRKKLDALEARETAPSVPSGTAPVEPVSPPPAPAPPIAPVVNPAAPPPPVAPAVNPAAPAPSAAPAVNPGTPEPPAGNPAAPPAIRTDADAPDEAAPTPRPRPALLRSKPKVPPQKPRTAAARPSTPIDIRPRMPRAQSGPGSMREYPLMQPQ